MKEHFPYTPKETNRDKEKDYKTTDSYFNKIKSEANIVRFLKHEKKSHEEEKQQLTGNFQDTGDRNHQDNSQRIRWLNQEIERLEKQIQKHTEKVHELAEDEKEAEDIDLSAENPNASSSVERVYNG